MRTLIIVAALWLAIPAFADDPCSEHYTEAIEVYDNMNHESREDLHAFLALARKTRSCKGAVPNALFRRLVTREIVTLGRLDAYQDMLVSLDLLRDSLWVLPIESRDDSFYVAWYHSTTGNAHYYLNDLNKAADAFAQAIRFSSYPVLSASYYLNFGNTLVRMQDIPAAYDSYRMARTVLDTVATRDDRWRDAYIRTLFSSADALLETVDSNFPLSDTVLLVIPQASELGSSILPNNPLEEAIALLHQTLALSQSPSRTVATLLELGNAYTLLGEPASALSYLLEAQEVALQTTEAHWQYQAKYALGGFYLKTGDFDKAEKALQEAYARINDARHRDYKRLSLNLMGLLYERKEDYAKAYHFYQQAIDTTEAYYASLRSTDWGAQVSEARYIPYRGKVRALLAQERFEEAFLQLAYSRARHLQDLQHQSRLVEDLSLEQRARHDSLIAAQNATLSALASDTLSATERTDLKAQEAHLAGQLKSLLRLKQPLSVSSLHTLQQALDADQVLISYFISEESVNGVLLPTPARSYAFVLDANGLQVFPLTTSVPDLVARIRQVSPALADNQAGIDFDARVFSLRALNELYDVLYAPLKAAIPMDARLVIVPDGPLFLLPFGMLVEEPAGDHNHQQAAYLVRKHAISEELAAPLLAVQADLDRDFMYDLAAFGKNDFSDISQTPAFRAVSLSADALPSLSGVEQEMQHIESLFRRKVMRLNASADEVSFSALAAQARVVHIASHTLINGKAPLQNAVILSANPNDDEDGLLYLHEIQRMRLPTQLAVLSGCNTARGVPYPGEGLAGLQYAFRAAGVPTTLATSWFVDDEASATLMASFYRHLQRGLTKDVALQQAQLEYLEKASRLETSPFFWAAPVLYGDVSSLDLQRPFPAWILPLCVLLLVALVFLGWRFSIHKRTST
ncbi:MAG TPA: CHAT domain-containing protein [Rhodothermales bacterium]|nr:CHAT domain-containing protein [Rhodothermales bacterium]